MFESESVAGLETLETAAWKQLAVMVNDGSGSMTLIFKEPDDSLEGVAPVRTKAAAVESALRDFLARLQASEKAANFEIAFLAFNDTVTDRRPPKPVVDIATNAGYDPTAAGVGGTAIHRALDAAAEVVREFHDAHRASELPVSAVVVLMSDGEERDDPVATAAAAKRLASLPNTKLAACLFATKDQEAHGDRLLESIVSEPRLYQRVYNTEQLRRFFMDSVTATRPALPAAGETGR